MNNIDAVEHWKFLDIMKEPTTAFDFYSSRNNHKNIIMVWFVMCKVC